VNDVAVKFACRELAYWTHAYIGLVVDVLYTDTLLNTNSSYSGLVTIMPPQRCEERT